MPSGDPTELILDHAREKRFQQDAQLQGLLRVATGALVVVLSAGTIAVAASEALAPSTAVVVLSFACILGLNLLCIEFIAHRWKDGPRIRRLLDVHRLHRPTLPQLQDALGSALDEDHEYNDKTLRRLRWLVLLQAAVVFAGLVILVTEFREIA